MKKVSDPIALALAVHASAARDAAIEELREKFAGLRRPQIRLRLLPQVAALHECPVVEGQGKAAGKLVLDSRHDNYEAARKALYRIVNLVLVKVALQESETKAPRSMQAAVDALVSRYKHDPKQMKLLRSALRKALES
jgi:hypothetical protein